jgi:hypothetical protein
VESEVEEGTTVYFSLKSVEESDPEFQGKRTGEIEDIGNTLEVSE